MNDITTLETTKEKIAEGDAYINELRKYFEKGYLTDDERYTLTIQK